MDKQSTLLRSLAVTVGITAAGALAALAIHVGMSNGSGDTTVSAKGAAQVTHAPQLATMQLGKTTNEVPMPAVTTTTTPGH